jgi:hypothetical protein
MWKLIIALPAAGLLWLGTSKAYAESSEFVFNRSMNDDYALIVGGYFANVDSRYQTSAKNGLASGYIDLERLGLGDNETQGFLYGTIRFSDRWRVDLHAFGTDRKSDRTGTFEIDLGDAGKIPVGARVETNFRAQIYAARVGYSFVRTDRVEFGAGAGLHLADLDIGIKGQVSVGSGTPPPPIQDGADLLAPLPTFGLFGAYALTRTLSLQGQLSFFALDYDKYDGSVVDTFIAIEYRPWEHIGLGAGYNVFDFDLEVTEDRRIDNYNVDFDGPVVYAKIAF